MKSNAACPRLCDLTGDPCCCPLLATGAHGGNRVGANGGAQRDEVVRVPRGPFVLGQALHNPPRRSCPGQDVERKDVSNLVDDTAVPLIGGLVDRQQDPVASWIGPEVAWVRPDPPA